MKKEGKNGKYHQNIDKDAESNTPMGFKGIFSFFRITAGYMPFNTFRKLLFRLGGVRIGKGTIIERGVKIGEEVNLGRNCIVLRLSRLHHCSLGDGVRVEELSVLRYVSIGRGSKIGRGSLVFGNPSKWMTLGEDVAVGVSWMIDGTGGLEVADHVNLGSHLGGIFTHSGFKHRILGYDFREKDHIERSPVKIGTCSWIGGKVTIQPGVTIGDHSAVLPNSSVSRDVAPYTMVGGVPARPLKRIAIEGDTVNLLPLK